jgi:CMP-2-keto-3-deoxyoctulosonic acid synthetase
MKKKRLFRRGWLENIENESKNVRKQKTILALNKTKTTLTFARSSLNLKRQSTSSRLSRFIHLEIYAIFIF